MTIYKKRPLLVLSILLFALSLVIRFQIYDYLNGDMVVWKHGMTIYIKMAGRGWQMAASPTIHLRIFICFGSQPCYQTGWGVSQR